MHRLIFAVLLCIAGNPASARMYQWVDPDNGTTQLSGKPPVWYRSGENGPRIFVFDKGRVIDDTGIDVSAAERNRLRQQALRSAAGESESDREMISPLSGD